MQEGDLVRLINPVHTARHQHIADRILAPGDLIFLDMPPESHIIRYFHPAGPLKWANGVRYFTIRADNVEFVCCVGMMAIVKEGKHKGGMFEIGRIRWSLTVSCPDFVCESVDKAYSRRVDALRFVPKFIEPKIIESKDCTCDIVDLARFGCRCGSIQPYQPKSVIS